MSISAFKIVPQQTIELHQILKHDFAICGQTAAPARKH